MSEGASLDRCDDQAAGAVQGVEQGRHPEGDTRRGEASRGRGEVTQVRREDQRVSGMVERVLFRQATARAGRTGETFGDALDAVLKTRASGQLVELRGGTHRDERADRWQKGLAPKRAEERDRDRREARRDAHREEREEGARVLQEAAWRGFVQEEMRELELRKDGQLAGALNRMRGGQPGIVAGGDVASCLSGPKVGQGRACGAAERWESLV